MLTILEGDGLRSLHFGSFAVQGAMRIDRPDDIELEYVQQMMMWMLFRDSRAHDGAACESAAHASASRASASRDSASHIVQLGLGAASLTKFCYRRLDPARVTAVELDPEVIEACRLHFALPEDDERLKVLRMDALDYVSDFSRRRTVDVMQVDLYNAQANGPVLGSASFYAACHSCLTADGIMTVNLYCDSAQRLEHIQAMQRSFAAVAWLPEVHDGNIVAIAFKRAPSVDFDVLYQRADEIHARTGLPAHRWVDGLQTWMQGALDTP